MLRCGAGPGTAMERYSGTVARQYGSTAVRRYGGTAVRRSSAETAGDVGFGGFLVRDAEDLLGGVHLDEAPGLAGAREVEEGRVLRDPGCLLHVVGHDHDRVVGLELVDQVLDRGGGDRVERRARLVHQQHLRLDRDGPGDAQALLLTAGEAHARLAEPVLDLVPQVGVRQGALDGS